MLIHPRSEEDILLYAFRYALGRQSYAVGVVVDALEYAWDGLRPDTRELIAKETKEAIATGSAGAAMGVAEWMRILEL